MKIGYVRVSKKKQNEQLQKDALIHYRCEPIFVKKISALALISIEFQKMKEYLQKGDEFLVWDTDRSSRTTLKLILFIDKQIYVK